MAQTVEALDSPLADRLRKRSRSPAYPVGGLVVSPPGCVVTHLYREHAPAIRDFEARDDDVWVVSFPKCGTTWTQEMVWLLVNDLNYEEAEKVPLVARVPFFEYSTIADVKDVLPEDSITFASKLSSPRIFKTHLPKQMLPKDVWVKKPKIIYISRNPKDAAVSYYHHHRLWNGYEGSMEEFMEAFLADVVVSSPFWDHVLEFWKCRDKEHILFNTYEEMKKDLCGVIERTAKFLGKKYSMEEVEKLADHLSFSKMKENPSVNLDVYVKEEIRRNHMNEEEKDLKFIRQGQAGAWTKALSPDTAARFDEWTATKLRDSDYDISLNLVK
ncbi:luciferin sulfotransferase-like [Bacillus rossius redtenbacheri]|uniref:luciferin sulfotransferase-like n=1 Tax=Bacillus rossius redtenbacheri TaxID=93214 RepID=UPI002FDE0747